MTQFIPPQVLRRFCRLFALALAGALSANAEELINDTFASGGANANGWYFYNSASAGTAWSTASAPVNATLLSGSTLRNNLGTMQNTVALKSFASFAFDEVGDSISLTMSFRSNGTTGTLHNVGFYSLTNDSIGANSFGGTDLTANTGGFFLTKSFAANSALTYRNVANETLFTSSATASIGDATDHTISFTLLMTVGGLQISSSIDGVSQGSHTVSSVTATSGFSVNALRLSANGSVTYYDNIVVTASSVSNIPEVGTAWLGVAAGAFAWFSVSRRRRSVEVGC